MLQKMSIANAENITDIINVLTVDAFRAVIDIIGTTYKNQEITRRQRAAYAVLCGIAAKTFNSKGYNSGDVETYDNLKNQMFGGVSVMFSGNNWMSYIDSACDVYYEFLQRVYRHKIVRSLERGRDYINVITTKRLRRIFRGLIDKAQNADIISDNSGVTIDIIHDLYAALAEYDVYIGDVYNYIERRYNDFDFAEFRDKYSRVYCGTHTRRIRLTDNTIITDKGIYKTDNDGVNRCKCQLQSKEFDSVVDVDDIASEFYEMASGTPRGVSVTLTDSAVIQGNWIEITKHRSVYDMLYAACNAAIEKNRRAYVSGDTYENLPERAERQAANDFIDIEIESAKTAITAALMRQGVKRETARKYAAFVSDIDSGYTQEEAAQNVGLSVRHFNRLTVRYADCIRAALTA